TTLLGAPLVRMPETLDQNRTCQCGGCSRAGTPDGRAAGRRWRPWCSRTVAASSPAMHRPSTRGVEMTDHSPDVPPAQADVPSTLAHRLTPMRGRDPSAAHRAATPLALLFGPTLVVAFRAAGQQASHPLAQDHTTAALPALG